MVLQYPIPLASFSVGDVVVPDYIEPVSANISSSSNDLGLPSFWPNGGASLNTRARMNVGATRSLTFGAHLHRRGTGFSIRNLSLESAAGNPLITFQTASQANGSLITIFRGDAGGTPLVTTSFGLLGSLWTFWEFAVSISAVSGTLHVWRNGQLVHALTGLNTQEFDEDIERVNYWDSSAFGETSWAIADGYIIDVAGPSAALGPVRIYDLKPNADDTPQDWTPSSGGDGFAMVDEARAQQSTGDNDYIESLNSGDVSKFDLEDLPAEVQNVHFVTAYGIARKPNAGGDTLIVGIDSDGNEEPSPEIDFGDPSYTALIHPFTVDPDGDVPWTPAKVNALKMFVEHGGGS